MFLHILKFVISFERGEKEPNAGHLKFCFASAAKISTQKLRVIFSNQKNKIFYPPQKKILAICCILSPQSDVSQLKPR